MRKTDTEALRNALSKAKELDLGHIWVSTGHTIDSFEPFLEKYCRVCRQINRGGKEDGICLGQLESGDSQ
jgi:hypothetical protein